MLEYHGVKADKGVENYKAAELFQAAKVTTNAHKLQYFQKNGTSEITSEQLRISEPPEEKKANRTFKEMTFDTRQIRHRKKLTSLHAGPQIGLDPARAIVQLSGQVLSLDNDMDTIQHSLRAMDTKMNSQFEVLNIQLAEMLQVMKGNSLPCLAVLGGPWGVLQGSRQ